MNRPLVLCLARGPSRCIPCKSGGASALTRYTSGRAIRPCALRRRIRNAKCCSWRRSWTPCAHGPGDIIAGGLLLLRHRGQVTIIVETKKRLFDRCIVCSSPRQITTPCLTLSYPVLHPSVISYLIPRLTICSNRKASFSFSGSRYGKGPGMS